MVADFLLPWVCRASASGHVLLKDVKDRDLYVGEQEPDAREMRAAQETERKSVVSVRS